LTWLDRSGKSLGTIGAPDSNSNILNDVELSPDGKRIAVDRTVDGNSDIWLIDAVRGVPTQLTFDAAANRNPVWSPDGNKVLFRSNRTSGGALYWKLSSGAGTDESLLASNPGNPTDWSSDGRFLLFYAADPQTGDQGLWVLPMSGDKKPFPFVKSPFQKRAGQFSPDGKWIMYESDESGRSEIYVQPFPGPGGKFLISSNGGVQPRWNKNGKEIFYVSLDSKITSVRVESSPDGQSLKHETPMALFPVYIPGLLTGAGRSQYAVSSDGQRFLVNLELNGGVTSPITLIYNWHPQAAK
jgi:Tol biopolymer transport system component